MCIILWRPFCVPVLRASSVKCPSWPNFYPSEIMVYPSKRRVDGSLANSLYVGLQGQAFTVACPKTQNTFPRLRHTSTGRASDCSFSKRKSSLFWKMLMDRHCIPYSTLLLLRLPSYFWYICFGNYLVMGPYLESKQRIIENNNNKIIRS